MKTKNEMKNIISSNFKNKIIITVCILLSILQNAEAQAELNPGNLAIPIAPGDRELTFTLPLGTIVANNLEVWVFYSLVQTDLTTINSNSFTSSKHYGRAIMLKAGSNMECHFVFPHSFHSVSPNRDLFCSYSSAGSTDLVTANFPGCTQGIPGIIGTFPEVKSTIKIDFFPLVVKKGECVFYRIYRRVKSGSTITDEALSAIRKFRMPDSFNIGIAGDSYASGEGAPNKEFNLGDNGDGLWISCPCHRSKKSGLLRGVKKFIDRNPEVAVDYSFTACSGAVTEDLYEVEQVTPDNRFALYSECGTANNPRQFQTIRSELIGSNKHDEMQMLLLNIGGNNSGFGDIVVNYLLEPRNLVIESFFPGILSEYTDRINHLDENYFNVNQQINEIFPEVRPIIGITVYPNPTSGLSGRCGCNGVMNPAYHCALYENHCTHSPRAEYQLLSDEFLIPLNSKVRETNKLFGWNVIDNINAGNHGLCNCEDPYFNVIGTSYDHLGDIYGLVHPNGIGYREMYKDKVYNFVDAKYKDYKALYYVAVLFGIKSPQPGCPEKLTLKSIALNLVYKNVIALNSIPGLQIVSTQLNTKELKSLAALNDEKQLLTNPTLTSLSNNAQLKTSIMNAPVSQTVIKTPQVAKPLFPIKPFGKNILKVKSDLNTYLTSQEFKMKVEEIKKLSPQPIKDSDPLDNLYNIDK